MDQKTGIIQLGVMDEDPKRAAKMANAFVEELKQVSSGLAISEASQKRLYFEEQLREVRKRLTSSEEVLRAYQERTGLQEAGAQTEAQVKALAELRAQVTAKEVQLGSLRSYATVANPEVRKLTAELAGLRSQLRRMEASSGSGRDPLNPAGGMPAARLEYLQKLRDVKFNEALFELLLKQYETAKLGEGSESAVVQVIDRAIPPELRFKPKRTLMVLLAGALGFFVSVFAAFVLEAASRMKADPEEAAKLEELRSALRLRRRRV